MGSKIIDAFDADDLREENIINKILEPCYCSYSLFVRTSAAGLREVDGEVMFRRESSGRHKKVWCAASLLASVPLERALSPLGGDLQPATKQRHWRR